jgi:hypothetical protein
MSTAAEAIVVNTSDSEIEAQEQQPAKKRQRTAREPSAAPTRQLPCRTAARLAEPEKLTEAQVKQNKAIVNLRLRKGAWAEISQEDIDGEIRSIVAAEKRVKAEDRKRARGIEKRKVRLNAQRKESQKLRSKLEPLGLVIAKERLHHHSSDDADKLPQDTSEIEALLVPPTEEELAEGLSVEQRAKLPEVLKQAGLQLISRQTVHTLRSRGAERLTAAEEAPVASAETQAVATAAEKDIPAAVHDGAGKLVPWLETEEGKASKAYAEGAPAAFRDAAIASLNTRAAAIDKALAGRTPAAKRAARTSPPKVVAPERSVDEVPRRIAIAVKSRANYFELALQLSAERGGKPFTQAEHREIFRRALAKAKGNQEGFANTRLDAGWRDLLAGPTAGQIEANKGAPAFDLEGELAKIRNGQA